jgi:hypothetical protein
MCDKHKIDFLKVELQKTYERIQMLDDAIASGVRQEVFIKEKTSQEDWEKQIKKQLWVEQKKCNFFRLFF